MNIQNPWEDNQWMGHALRLARKGQGTTRPNPPVGAVIVRNGRIVGTGYHSKAGEPHAEIHALKASGGRSKGATLYVTLEPCCTWGRTPPCTDAIIASGIKRVVYGADDPNPRHSCRACAILSRAGIVVDKGIREDECAELIAPFAKWIRSGVPRVTLKMAVTLDGRIGDRSGNSKWISCEESRAEVQRLRSISDAIMVGAGTATLDNPSLLFAGDDRRAVKRLRVIADSSGRTPLDARIMNDGRQAQTVIATTRRCPRKRRLAFEKKGASVRVVAMRGGRVNLAELLKLLGKMGVLSVLCEGGSELAGSLVQEGLVDEYVFFVAPRFLGDNGSIPALRGTGWLIGKEPRARIVACERSGTDVMIRALREK